MEIKVHPEFKNYGYNINDNNIYHIPLNKIVKQLPQISGYAKNSIKHGTVQISTLSHRFIFECCHGPIEKGFEIDHINRNKLDNKIDNLRCITIEENRKNRDHTNIIKFARISHTLKRFIKSINVDTNEINCFKSKYQCGMYYGVSPALVYLIAENKNLAKTANTNKGKIKFEYVDEKDVCNLVEIPHARIGKTYKKLKVT